MPLRSLDLESNGQRMPAEGIILFEQCDFVVPIQQPCGGETCDA